VPHYAEMPPSASTTFLAWTAGLKPLLARLDAADPRAWTDCASWATGARGIALDEQASGSDLRWLWTFSEAGGSAGDRQSSCRT